MTPDELATLVRTCHPKSLVEKVRPLTDKERRSLSKTAAALLSECRRKERDFTFGLPVELGARARLAVLAVCPWGQAQRVRFGDFRLGVPWFRSPQRRPVFQEFALQILIDRKPDWADNWVQRQLEDRFPEMSWDDLTRLIQHGACERPTSDAYIRFLAVQLHGMDFDSDPHILEKDIWRLFEVDTNAFQYVPALKEINRDDWAATLRDPQTSADYDWLANSWPRYLYHFAAQGRIDRGRLLDEVLRALWCDFSASTRAGLVRFHDILEPTDEEIAEREEAYVEHLRNPHGSLVAMALKAVEGLVKAGSADGSNILAQIPQVFQLSSKTQPIKAVRVIDRTFAGRPELVGDAVAALEPALEHASPDVQEAAVKLLEKWVSKLDDLPLEPLARTAELVSPALRGRLEALLGQSSPGHGEFVHAAAERTDDISDRRRRLLERIRALPEELRATGGLAEADACLTAAQLPSPWSPDPATFPVLTGVEPIEPIGSVDELIDAVAHAFEVMDSPEQLERIVDGILRLGGQRCEDFDARVAGLRSQPAEQADLGSRGLIAGATPLPAALALIADWLGSRCRWLTAAPELPGYARIAAFDRLDVHFRALRSRYRSGQFGPVVASPTHRGGWIDPGVFVARLTALADSNIDPGRHDLELALLRLAPDHRADALRAATAVPEPYGRVVRYALGEGEHPTQGDRKQAALWVAAGRARNPAGRLGDLAALNVSEKLPDAVVPGEYVLHPEVVLAEAPRWLNRIKRSDGFGEVVPSPPRIRGKPDADLPLPVVLAQLVRYGYVWFADWLCEMLTTIWPLRPDACLAWCCDLLLLRHDEPASPFEPAWRLLAPLLTPDRAWSAIAQTALWIGLLGRDENARGICLDALIEGIADGRAHPEPLAEALFPLQQAGRVKHNRLAGALREVARTSPLAEWVVADILDRLIASWDSVPRDGHYVLSFHIELLATLGRALSDGARERLAGIKGSGKAAKLAVHLCGLSPSPNAGARHEAVLAALEGRLKRGERIARAAGNPNDQVPMTNE